MECTLTLNAAAHRLWYIAGDTVKVRVTLTCSPVAASEAKGGVVAMQAAPQLNYFSVDTSEAESRELDLHVQTLTTELAGVVELDASVMKPIFWPAATSSTNGRVSGRPSSGRSRALYHLYNTGFKTLQENVCLKRYQCVAFEFELRLPEGCPSSFTGKAADYRHILTIVAAWRNTRAGAGRIAVPHICKVRVPLTVYNTLASVAQLPLMALFPLPPTAALVMEDFHFAIVTLPAVPTTSVAAPLDDVLRPQETQLRTSLTVRQGSKASLQNALATQRQPLSLRLPCDGVDVVQVQLLSSSVALGDFLGGSFTVLDTSDNTRQSQRTYAAAPVVVTVTAALELLECVTPEWALVSDETSMQDTKAQGMENFVCVHKRIIEHERFNLLDTPSVSFEFPLPVGHVPPSTITDITAFLWQLRVVVTAVTRKSMMDTSKAGVDVLGPLLEPAAAVFPLLIVPPAVSAKGRQGAVW